MTRLALRAAAAATLLLIVTPQAQGQGLPKKLGNRVASTVSAGSPMRNAAARGVLFRTQADSVAG